MRHPLTLLFLCFSCLVSAQRSSLDFSGGLHYSFRTINADEEHDFILAARTEERGIVTGQVGLHYSRQFTDAYGFRSGLRLTALGHQQTATNLRWGNQHDGNGGFDPSIDPMEPDGFTIRHDMLFVEVPLLWHQSFGTMAWTPFVEVGFLPGAYLTTRSQATGDGTSETNYHDDTQSAINRFQLSSALSLGVDHYCSERFGLFVQANYRYQLTPLANGGIKERLYALGFEMGVRRSLP
ncbi:MAG: outer membrane beta-barrel protein [Lewinella sp.]